MSQEIVPVPPSGIVPSDDRPRPAADTPTNPLPAPTGSVTFGARNYNSKVGIPISLDGEPPKFDGVFKQMPGWMDTIASWIGSDGPMRVVYVELCITDYTFNRNPICLGPYVFDFGGWTYGQDDQNKYKDSTGNAYLGSSDLLVTAVVNPGYDLKTSNGLGNLIAFRCALESAATNVHFTFQYLAPTPPGGPATQDFSMSVHLSDGFSVVGSIVYSLNSTYYGDSNIYTATVDIPGVYNAGTMYQVDFADTTTNGVYIWYIAGSFS